MRMNFKVMVKICGDGEARREEEGKLAVIMGTWLVIFAVMVKNCGDGGARHGGGGKLAVVLGNLQMIFAMIVKNCGEEDPGAMSRSRYRLISRLKSMGRSEPNSYASAGA